MQAIIFQKAEAERKAIAEQKERERIELENQRKLALAPRKDKLVLWINSFEGSTIPVDQNDEIALEIMQKFNAFKTWAFAKVNSIS